MPKEIEVAGPIALGSFLKLSGAVPTGGEAKRLVQGGAVRVNGKIELRRGHHILPGDVVEAGGERYVATPSATSL